MTRDQVIAQMASDRMVEQMLKSIAKVDALSPDLEDLCQMVYLALLEYKGVGDYEIVYMYENQRMPYFLARVLMNQFNSKNSPYYRQLKRFTENMTSYKGHDKADE